MSEVYLYSKENTSWERMGNSHRSVKQTGMDVAHLYNLCVRTHRSIKHEILVKYKQKRTPKARKMKGICPSIQLCAPFLTPNTTQV